MFFVGASEFMLSAMLDPLGRAFGVDSGQIAWLVSSYALAYALAAPVFGHLSDRIGRRRLLLIALFLFALDGLGIALAPTFEIAVALRILGGTGLCRHHSQRLRVGLRTLAAPASCGGDGRRHARHDGGHRDRPAIAGVLTGWIGWRAPFLLVSAGCLAAFLVYRMAMPGGRAPTAATVAAQRPLRWLRKPDIAHPCSPRDCGTGRVSPPFCCREKSCACAMPWTWPRSD
ncbi:MFS transporter [Achromobacter xylosoxidans]